MGLKMINTYPGFHQSTDPTIPGSNGSFLIIFKPHCIFLPIFRVFLFWDFGEIGFKRPIIDRFQTPFHFDFSGDFLRYRINRKKSSEKSPQTNFSDIFFRFLRNLKKSPEKSRKRNGVWKWSIVRHLNPGFRGFVEQT